MLEIEKRKEVPMLKGEDNFGRGRREAHEGREIDEPRASISSRAMGPVTLPRGSGSMKDTILRRRRAESAMQPVA